MSSWERLKIGSPESIGSLCITAVDLELEADNSGFSMKAIEAWVEFINPIHCHGVSMWQGAAFSIKCSVGFHVACNSPTRHI